MSASKVLLILGAGGNVGASVAKLFAQKGYKVAIAARRLDDAVDNNGQLQIKTDLSHPESVDSAFDKVTAEFGAPNVVVYNGIIPIVLSDSYPLTDVFSAAAVHFVSGDNPLELSVQDFNQDLTVNTTSALVAARRAVKGFDGLSSQTPKVFIYTGNFLNTEVLPAMISAGMGKSAAAHIMATASRAYASKGYK